MALWSRAMSIFIALTQAPYLYNIQRNSFLVLDKNILGYKSYYERKMELLFIYTAIFGYKACVTISCQHVRYFKLTGMYRQKREFMAKSDAINRDFNQLLLRNSCNSIISMISAYVIPFDFSVNFVSHCEFIAWLYACSEDLFEHTIRHLICKSIAIMALNYVVLCCDEMFSGHHITCALSLNIAGYSFISELCLV